MNSKNFLSFKNGNVGFGSYETKLTLKTREFEFSKNQLKLTSKNPETELLVKLLNFTKILQIKIGLKMVFELQSWS